MKPAAILCLLLLATPLAGCEGIGSQVREIVGRTRAAFCERYGAELAARLQAGLKPEVPDNVEGFVILGGGLWAYQHSDGGAGDRIKAALELTRKYPRAILLFTGRGEAETIGAMLVREGVTAPILLEPSAKNTYENAVNSRALIGARIERPWVIITSAWHIKRSLATFRAQGFDAHPYPVDYLKGSPDQVCATAMRETLSYMYYLVTWRL